MTTRLCCLSAGGVADDLAVCAWAGVDGQFSLLRRRVKVSLDVHAFTMGGIHALLSGWTMTLQNAQGRGCQHNRNVGARKAHFEAFKHQTWKMSFVIDFGIQVRKTDVAKCASKRSGTSGTWCIQYARNEVKLQSW